MRSLVLMVLAIGAASPIAAQERATEFSLGIAAMGFTITADESLFQFEGSQRILSLSMYQSPSVAVKSSAAISVAAGGDATVTAIEVGFAVPIHTRRTWGRSGPFFAPGIAFRNVNIDGRGSGASGSQFSLGLGVGNKIPIADPVSLSVSGNFAYAIESDALDNGFSFGAQLGLSVFFQ